MASAVLLYITMALAFSMNGSKAGSLSNWPVVTIISGRKFTERTKSDIMNCKGGYYAIETTWRRSCY